MPNSFPHDPGLDTSAANSAADLIRHKLDKLYSEEPDASKELQESQSMHGHRSKHQQFMYDLGKSGKSLAEIQVDWHNYYAGLTDAEKHQVWQEFYQEHNQKTHHKPSAQPKHEAAHTPHPLVKQSIPQHHDQRTVADIRKHVTRQVRQRSRAKRGGHLHSLTFGLSMGSLVLFILLFGFFNERFIAPFISPSKNVSANSIIIDPTSTAVGPESKIIIPKINVDIPVIYDEPSIAEKDIQSALERGVVHYATTSDPGEAGNGAIFGHSSNNILNRGKYKFAFVLLRRLEPGDTFILQKDGKRYVYRVFHKEVVSPEEIGVLTKDYGKPATFSLITCDPPGTALKRLVVTGEQITPNPADNATNGGTDAQPEQPAILPGNSESLWQRLVNWLSS